MLKVLNMFILIFSLIFSKNERKKSRIMEGVELKKINISRCIKTKGQNSPSHVQVVLITNSTLYVKEKMSCF